MKFTATIFAVVAASASAFAPVAFAPKASSCLNANIVDTVSSLQGPGVVWGAEGVMLGHDENDHKGYDNFGSFIAAVNSAGLSDILKGAGPFTVFAPTDSAMAAYKGAITPEFVKYHIAKGSHSSGSLGANLPTLNGKELTYGRRFRKNFIDDAIIGQADNFGGGSAYPTDITCDNGIVHAISVVLEP